MKALKGVVLLLVLANVGYFLYAQGIAPPLASPPPAGSGGTLKFAAVKSPPAAAAATASAPGARCVSVGPFAEQAELAHAQATLRSGGYAPRQRAADADVPDGVLVYLAMPATPAATAQLRRKLKAAGIADAPDLPGPSDTVVLSLGMFSDPQRAQARMASLRRAGFSPQSLEHKRSGTVFWLDVDLKPDDAPVKPADLHGETGHALPLEARECPAPGVDNASAGAPPAPVIGDATTAASAVR